MKKIVTTCFAAVLLAATPVFAGGVTSRLNAFGFAIVEVYYARPFQRPGRGGVWGFSLQPGW